jgi:hypothetical protein
VEHGTALHSKSLQIVIVLDVCVAQKAPVADVLSGKTWVFIASVAVAVKMLPG